MAAYTNIASQDVLSGEAVVFSETLVPCTRGLVRHRDGDTSFMLSGWSPYDDGYSLNGCPCCNNSNAEYLVTVKANIAIPTTGTAGEISLALAVNGSVLPASSMRVTPTATGAFFNVAVSVPVDIWEGCCQSLSLVNTSTQGITVDTPLIGITRPDLIVSY